MSSNFYPSQTSQIPGIEGALNPQYPDAAQMPMPESGPPASPNYVEVLREHQVQTQEANAPQDSIQSYSINAKTGMAKIEIPQSALAEVMGQLTDLKTMKTAAMARVAQLRQQESSGSPILDALSQFAGNMASNDPTMPGWVRALGQTNLQMGSQGIKRERMAEEQKAFAYGKEIADTALQAEKISEYSATQRSKGRDSDLDERRVAVLEKQQAANELNQRLDNYRADLKPVADVIGKTGLFNADHETAIRRAAANHPGLPPWAVEAEIAKAKGNAAAAKAEIDRKAAQARLDISLRAGEYASRLAAQEGKQIRGQVVRANLAQAGKMADTARIDEKEALRLQGLNEMSIAADRMQSNIEADPAWQGVIAGRVAETAKLTTAQQKMLSDSADLFVKKMSSLGVSFAKTSDAEMKKILATVPSATMTVQQAKNLIEIINQEGQRAAEFVAQRNWAETPDSIAGALPAKYRDAALRAHSDKVAKLTPQQRLALGLTTGDKGLIISEVERAISGAPGGRPSAPNSTRPGEIKMAAPTANPRDPLGIR